MLNRIVKYVKSPALVIHIYKLGITLRFSCQNMAFYSMKHALLLSKVSAFAMLFVAFYMLFYYIFIAHFGFNSSNLLPVIYLRLHMHFALFTAGLFMFSNNPAVER